MTATANNSPRSGSGTRPAYTGHRSDVVDKFTHCQQTGVVAVLGCQVSARETRAAPSQTVPVILSKEDLTMSLGTIRCQIPMEITWIDTLWVLVRSPQYTHVSFLHIQTNLDTALSLILSKSMTTLLSPNPSYPADFSVSEGGKMEQNIAQDPSSTQTQFWLFISLIDCIRELQHQAHHI